MTPADRADHFRDLYVSALRNRIADSMHRQTEIGRVCTALRAQMEVEEELRSDIRAEIARVLGEAS